MGGFLNDLANMGQAVVAQINPFDNGRTYNSVRTYGANYTPKPPNQSVWQQATHNGVTNAAGDVLHGFTNVIGAPVNMGRGMFDQFVTHNYGAANNDYNLALQDAHNNIVTGIGHQLAGFGQAGADLFGKQLAATLTNNQVASNNANTAFVRDINKTPIGQLLDPVQHQLANYQVNRDLKQLNQSQRQAAVKQNLSNVGINPNETLGGQMLQSGLGAMQMVIPDKIVNGVPIAQDLAAKGAKVAAVSKAGAAKAADTAAAIKAATPQLNEIGAVGKNVNGIAVHNAISKMNQTEIKNLVNGNYGHPEQSTAAASRTNALVNKGLIQPAKDAQGAYANTHELTPMGQQIHNALTDPNGALPVGVHPAQTAKPTPKQMWGDHLIEGNYKGKPYLSNGYIMDFNSKLEGKQNFAPVRHNAGENAPTSAAIDKIVQNAKGNVAVKPSEFQPATTAGIYHSANPTLILRNGDNVVGVQPQYYNYFTQKYGPNIKVNFDPANPLGPLRVTKNGKTVGLLMPLKGSEARLPATKAALTTETANAASKAKTPATPAAMQPKALPAKSSVGYTATIHGHTPADLVNMAHAQKDEFINHTKAVAQEHGGTVTEKTISNAVKKDHGRIAQKINQKGGHAPTDILRTIIHHPDPHGSHQAIIQSYLNKGYDLYKHPVTGEPDITNRYLDKNPGYKDVAFKLVKPGASPDHIVKEVQIMSPEMAKAKGIEQGHALYKVSRNPETKNPARINAISDKIYARALRAETNRSNPSRVISLPSDLSLSKGTASPVKADTASTPRSPERLSSNGAPSSSKNLGKAANSAGEDGNRTDIPKTITENPSNGKMRSLTKNMKQSPEFSPDLQKTIDSSYQPFTDKAATMATDQFMKQPLKDAQAQVMAALSHHGGYGARGDAFTMAGGFGKQEVANAGAVMKALDQKGDIQGAQAIHDLLAQKLTNAGQTAQATQLIYNRTPQGLMNMAYRELTNAGVKITPELKGQLDAAKTAIENAKPGSREETIAKAKFAQLAEKHLPSSGTDKAVSLYKTGILSAPLTAVKVAMVNPITNVLEQAKDFPAAAVDRAVSTVTGKRTLVAPNAQNIGAGLKAAGTTGLKDAKMRLVDNIAMPGSTGMGSTELSAVGKRAGGANFGVTKTGQRSLLDKATGGASSKVLNGYTSAVGRVHGAIQTPGYEGRAAQSLMQQAQAEAINQGLKGADRQAFIQKFMANPPKDAYERAQTDAQYASSQQHTALGAAASGLQHNLGPVGQVIAPITRIPGAVATQMINYSPAGFVKTAGKAIADKAKGNEFDQRAFAQGTGRAVVGSGLMAGGAALMAQGRMSGAYPTDKGTQALWQQANIPENSVYVGGHAFPNQPWKNYGGTWEQVGSPGGPAAQSMLAGGQAYQGYKKGGAAGLVEQGTAGAAKIATNQPYLTGISGVMTAINTPDQAKQFYDQTAGSVVPNFLRTAASATDPLQRQTSVQSPVTSMKNAITNGIPGLREKNQPQVDVYGNTLPRNAGPVSTYLNPLKPQSSRPSQLVDQLGAIHNQQDVNGKALTIPTQIAKKYPITLANGQKVPLTDAQRTQFIQQSGQASQAELAQLFNSPDYQNADAATKSKMIGDVVSGQRDVAKQAYGSATKLSSAGKAVQQGRLPVVNAKGNASTSANGISPNLPAQYKATLQQYANMSTDQRNKVFATQNDAQYKYDLATYQNKLAAGKLDMAQQIRGTQTLKKDQIGSNYSQTVRQVYSLSKAEINNYLSGLPSDQANALYNQLISYGDALVSGGIDKKNKISGVGSGSGSSSTSSKANTALTTLDKKLISDTASLAKKSAGAKVKKMTLADKVPKIKPTYGKTYAVKRVSAVAKNSRPKAMLASAVSGPRTTRSAITASVMKPKSSKIKSQKIMKPIKVSTSRRLLA